MQGFHSVSRASISAFIKMWIFNLVVVLLASVYAPPNLTTSSSDELTSYSLYHVAVDIVSEGVCELLRRAAESVPDTSDLFISYVLNEALLVTPLLDFVQVNTK